VDELLTVRLRERTLLTARAVAEIVVAGEARKPCFEIANVQVCIGGKSCESVSIRRQRDMASCE
jgi:hypothetical protein